MLLNKNLYIVLVLARVLDNMWPFKSTPKEKQKRNVKQLIVKITDVDGNEYKKEFKGYIRQELGGHMLFNISVTARKHLQTWIDGITDFKQVSDNLYIKNTDIKCIEIINESDYFIEVR